MPKAGRSSQKSPPSKREPMKQSQPKPKKTFAELCQERIHTIHDAKREKDDLANKIRHQAEEDEIMAMTYGPNWRDRFPEEPKSAKVMVVSPEEDDDEGEDEYDIPLATGSRIRLRAS